MKISSSSSSRSGRFQFYYSPIQTINYVTAKKLGVRLLTGDKEFKDLENVKFIK